MNDVEKYGLFAVVFVGGLLLVIGLQGGFSSAPKVAPVVIGGDVPPLETSPAAGPATSAGNRVRVKSIMPETSFDWSEPPIAYPGERSSALPSTSEEAAPLNVVAPAGAPVAATSAPPAKPVAAPAPTGMHTVAKDETLSSIAARYLGSESRWKELVKLNPGLDPRKLKIGQQLRVAPAAGTGVAAAPTTPVKAADAPAATGKPAPAPAIAPATATVAGRTHTVVKGDTLGAIAKKYLGSTTRADDIYAANKDVLKSKDDLKLGQVLRIP